MTANEVKMQTVYSLATDLFFEKFIAFTPCQLHRVSGERISLRFSKIPFNWWASTSILLFSFTKNIVHLKIVRITSEISSLHMQTQVLTDHFSISIWQSLNLLRSKPFHNLLLCYLKGNEKLASNFWCEFMGTFHIQFTWRFRVNFSADWTFGLVWIDFCFGKMCVWMKRSSKKSKINTSWKLDKGKINEIVFVMAIKKKADGRGKEIREWIRFIIFAK